jgi:hypothetical protein
VRSNAAKSLGKWEGQKMKKHLNKALEKKKITGESLSFEQ